MLDGEEVTDRTSLPTKDVLSTSRKKEKSKLDVCYFGTGYQNCTDIIY